MPAAKVKEPTVKQRRFAAGMAMGQTKVDAYLNAYPNTKAKRTTVKGMAMTTSRKAAVQNELQRLLDDPILQPAVLEPCAAARDPQQLREHAVSIMLKLTRHSDAQVAFHAASWLAAYADAIDLAKAKPAPVAPERAAILAELRGLYAKALRTRPSIVETVAEVQAGPGQAQASTRESASGQVEPAPAAGEV